MEPTIRLLQAADNPFIAEVIKTTLAEFGANHKGTVYDDPSTDHLSELFNKERAAYFVIEINRKIVGGGGLYPTEGLPPDTCEFVKMYLLPEARGLGLGKTLIMKNLELASELGYKHVYLESMPELKKALNMYEKFGWQYLDAPMGNSGHTGCSLWMIREVFPLRTPD